MIETYIRPHIQPLFNSIACAIANKLSASRVTGISFLTGISAAFCIAMGHQNSALIMLLISGLCDILDGTLARVTKTAHICGAFFDLISDRLVESALIAGFAYAYPENFWAYLCFHTALLFHFSTFFMANSLLQNTGKKSIHYHASIIERAEAFIAFFAMIILPQYIFTILMILNALIIFDAWRRFFTLTKQYSNIAFILLLFLSGDSMSQSSVQSPNNAKIEKATFAGGCFWCMQPPFEKLQGVISVKSGYTGGTGINPNYKDYAQKGHIEAIEVNYDPSKITYQKLLETFWHQINPTDNDGQFVDRGPQYRSEIFYHTPEQQKLAEASKQALEKAHQFDKPIVTQIKPAQAFYPAEEYHQDYYKKNPIRYYFYRSRSGRDAFLEKAWEADKVTGKKKFVKPTDQELHKKLTPIQYNVTQKNKTEKPFDNAYWNNERAGIYVDLISGEPLFSSLDKFDSGTGWPSFTKPLDPDNIVEKDDWTWITKRKEIRSKVGDAHLGHVFNDGPAPTRLRYCMNSAALRFIPVEDLEKEGYGRYKALFTKK
jgi:peptide methionine sulfoxide reductase msrA/msrB